MSNAAALLKKNFPLGTTEALPSLEALLTLTAAEVSNEEFEGILGGVGNLFGDLFRNIAQGRRPNVKKIAKDRLLSSLRLAANSYYGNRAWLEKRRIITGDIKAAGIAEFLSIDGVVTTDPDRIRVVADSVAPFTNDYLAEIERWKKAVMPISNRLRNERLTRDTLADILPQLQSIPHADMMFNNKLERTFKYELGKRLIQDGEPTAPQKNPVKYIRALTVDEIIDVSNVIVMLMNRIAENIEAVDDKVRDPALCFTANEGWHGWKDIEDQVYGKFKIFKYAPNDLGRDVNPWLRLAYKGVRAAVVNTKLAESWSDVAEVFSGAHYYGLENINSVMYDTALALARYIDRSIR